MDENQFSVKLEKALDIVNLSAQEAMSSLSRYGGKDIVIVDNEGSHWRGNLIGYNFMYLEINRHGERMKIPCDNIKTVLVDVEGHDEIGK